MLSGVSSFTSSIGHSKKSAFQQCIPMIIAILLAIEFLIIVVIIAFYDKSKNSDNYFYISTVSYFIFSTIYFAWHSIVKVVPSITVRFRIGPRIILGFSVQF